MGLRAASDLAFKTLAGTVLGRGAAGRIARAVSLAAVVLGANVAPTMAQGLPLIRDTEIEDLLNDYARPIFKAAGLGTGRVQMRIVKSDSFNAFVIDGRNVFIHTGTLMQADTPNQVIGVIAHEAGHIAGGHMAALRARIAKDQTRALLMQILGIGIMVAGGVSGDSNVTGAGTGVLYGGSDMVMRSLLSERRSQESAADQAGLSYLNATQQSGRGMLETFERFAQQEYISDTHKDPFVRSHPVATDRLNQLRRLVTGSKYYSQSDTAELQLRHDLMRAKLAGYLDPPAAVFNRYPVTDKSLPARYARGLARFFRGGPGGLEGALTEIDGLVRERPNNPYFHEVKGDLLMRSGKSREAIPHLRKALQLTNGSSLIRVQLAAAIQNAGDKSGLAESVSLLRKSLVEDKNPRAYRLLATAYYNQGRRPQADAMTAQAYFLEGNLQQAQIFAKRAQSQLKPGSPEWIQNDDILTYKPPA
ncbi:M48 family metalloprotease [Filomicrobium sp.]|uniref:M48 family metalloprotease n=1 Tax=Filomicrobium sp. TaxID=2024831 RepID=UPI002585E546|nr:M48 family metalloprotease [Filomicrobium sp.]MCV0368882.1 M48 family metalloprotease [Filomicrobium sp.]